MARTEARLILYIRFTQFLWNHRLTPCSSQQIVTQLIMIFPIFYGSRRLISIYEPDSGPYLEADQSNLHPHFVCLSDKF
jgi:hypothetical protein